jgi:hypothetical protein
VAGRQMRDQCRTAERHLLAIVQHLRRSLQTP